MFKKRTGLATLAVFALVSSIASADVIDFEGGTFSDLDPVGTVATPSNSVTFSISGGGTGFIAEVGGPITAFVPGDMAAGGAGGDFSLSDENVPNSLTVTADYFLQFAIPVSELSLDVFDYRGDGGSQVGDVATLTVFSDSNFTNVIGTDTFVITPMLPDGAVANLSVSGGLIRSASVTFSRGDVGTAIDNIEFTTAPEPASIILWSLLLVAGVAGVIFRRRSALPAMN